MRNKFKIFILTLIFGLMVFSPVLAQEGVVPCGQRPAAGEKAEDCEFHHLLELGMNVINFLITAAGSVTLLFMVIGGLRMLFSGGNPEQIKAGRTTLLNALLGLFIVGASYLILSFVISTLSGGEFGDLNALIDLWK